MSEDGHVRPSPPTPRDTSDLYSVRQEDPDLLICSYDPMDEDAAPKPPRRSGGPNGTKRVSVLENKIGAFFTCWNMRTQIEEDLQSSSSSSSATTWLLSSNSRPTPTHRPTGTRAILLHLLPTLLPHRVCPTRRHLGPPNPASTRDTLPCRARPATDSLHRPRRMSPRPLASRRPLRQLPTILSPRPRPCRSTRARPHSPRRRCARPPRVSHRLHVIHQ
jgi:hypothetical protein